MKGGIKISLATITRNNPNKQRMHTINKVCRHFEDCFGLYQVTFSTKSDL